MKKILTILALLALALLPDTAKAQTASPGEWRLHNSYHGFGGFGFDRKIVDTPDKVYMLSLGLGCWTWSTGYNIEYPMLFVYDKQNDEIEGYNARNYLHGNIVKNMWYNAAKKYFLLVYDDYNIDILYTDDRCYNVPGLASAIVPGGKGVNFATFDAENNRAYVGTTFGYLVIDDSKNVITESHIYGKNIKSIARIGEHLVAATDEGLFYSPLKSNDHHSTWNSFSKITDGPTAATHVLQLDGNSFLYTNEANRLFKGSIGNDGVVTLDPKDIAGTNITNVTETSNGYFMNTGWEGALVDRQGNKKSMPKTDAYRNLTYGASSQNELWVAAAPKGFTHLKYDGSAWICELSSAFGEYIIPNSPVVFDGGTFAYSPKYGVITTNTGYAHFHGETSVDYDMIISRYKDGIWDNIMTTSGASNKNTFMANTPQGILDPYNEDVVWAGSAKASVVKFDMSDMTASKFTPAGTGNANCATPKFDKNGTMWTVRTNPGNLCYWTKAARDAATISEFKSIAVPEYSPSQFPVFQPCTTEGRTNLIVLALGNYNSDIWVYDHNGTLDNKGDDRYVHITNLIDQDGMGISMTYVYAMTEDPATGRIWVGGDGGVYWFDPKTAFDSNFHVNRVKVPRNDGTNLADYLLEGSSIYCIGIDGAGHKWFGTLGNGLVETSATGAEIINQFTIDNSYLPSNDVISVGFEPDSNCVWIGTKKGLAQYYSETAPGRESLDEVLAYPNPVRPEYYGHVTIKGLMDGSLVKILDAQGGLVRELGLSEGGMMLWDLTNMNGRRVPTGVYYVATSSTGENGEANVTKILVMN